MKQLFPNFVSSESEEGLIKEMAQVSIRRGGTVNFFSVYYNTAKRTHVAWYHDDMENLMAKEYAKLKGKEDAGRLKD